MPEPRPTVLDTAVSLFVGLAAAVSVSELVRAGLAGEPVRAGCALVAAVALMTALVVAWRSRNRLVPQVAGLVGCAGVAWASGMDPLHNYSYLAIMLLIGIVFRHGERLRLARNRADLLADRA